MDPIAGTVFGAGLVMLAAAVHLVRNQAAGGGIGRNSAVGIRTRATLASDRAWAAGHDAAVPMLTAACRTGYPIGVITLLIGLAGAPGGTGGPVVLAVPLTGFVVVLALLAAAAVKADSTARAVTPAGREGGKDGW